MQIRKCSKFPKVNNNNNAAIREGRDQVREIVKNLDSQDFLKFLVIFLAFGNLEHSYLREPLGHFLAHPYLVHS